jgi:hypothetical protein
MAEDRCVAISVDRADRHEREPQPNIKVNLDNKPNKHMDPVKTY